MKLLKRLPLCLLLTLVLGTSALAAPVPNGLTVENLNGQQRLVKTYTLLPGEDPNELRDADFEYDGFLYTWAYTLKEEHPYLDTKAMTRTVTVETAKKDLALILEQLAPTISYDDGEYTGELALDHTSLSTEAAGYITKYSTTTETKVIGGLDRNDMSYVPATTVKNGKTLSLANVDWQVTGTALVGEALVPAQYQAVATYSASSSYQAATGYVTTAEYHGKVSSAGVESITYTVVYTGEFLEPPIPEPSGLAALSLGGTYLFMMGLLLAVLAVLLLLRIRQKNVNVFIPTGEGSDYKLISRQKITKEAPTVDLRKLNLSPGDAVAVEIKRRAVKKLSGSTVTALCPVGEYAYTVSGGRRDDWHEFQLPLEEEAPAAAEEVAV